MSGAMVARLPPASQDRRRQQVERGGDGEYRLDRAQPRPQASSMASWAAVNPSRE